MITLRERGVTIARRHAALTGECLLDHQRRFQRHGVRNVEEVGRGRHYRLMDLFELLRGAITLDADGVAQALVARSDGGIDSEEASEVDFAFGLDLQMLEGDSSD